MPPVTNLCLLAPNKTGAALRLQPDDRLIGVNGVAFAGSAADLDDLFAKATTRALALTFRRRDQTVTLLAGTAHLGEWDQVAGDAAALDTGRINPDVLINWEVLGNSAGAFDLHPLRGSALALIAPPLWMLQMRLWVPGAALVAAAMVALAVSPLMFLAVYLTAGLHLWHCGPRYFRNDRTARGLTPRVILAAPSETAAHKAYLRLVPDARFVFAPAPAPKPEQAV